MEHDVPPTKLALTRAYSAPALSMAFTSLTVPVLFILSMLCMAAAAASDASNASNPCTYGPWSAWAAHKLAADGGMERCVSSISGALLNQWSTRPQGVVQRVGAAGAHQLRSLCGCTSPAYEYALHRAHQPQESVRLHFASVRICTPPRTNLRTPLPQLSPNTDCAQQQSLRCCKGKGRTPCMENMSATRRTKRSSSTASAFSRAPSRSAQEGTTRTRTVRSPAGRQHGVNQAHSITSTPRIPISNACSRAPPWSSPGGSPGSGSCTRSGSSPRCFS